MKTQQQRYNVAPELGLSTSQPDGARNHQTPAGLQIHGDEWLVSCYGRFAHGKGWDRPEVATDWKEDRVGPTERKRKLSSYA
jgi:hypothetical protein